MLIESSFNLITGLIIIILITGFSVYEVQLFNHYRLIREFSNSITEVVNQIELLPKLSDYGSFTSVRVSVPQGYNLTFSNTSNSLLITGNEELSINLSRSLINELVLTPGVYNLELYYGDSVSEGPYVVGFK